MFAFVNSHAPTMQTTPSSHGPLQDIYLVQLHTANSRRSRRRQHAVTAGHNRVFTIARTGHHDGHGYSVLRDASWRIWRYDQTVRSPCAISGSAAARFGSAHRLLDAHIRTVFAPTVRGIDRRIRPDIAAFSPPLYFGRPVPDFRRHQKNGGVAQDATIRYAFGYPAVLLPENRRFIVRSRQHVAQRATLAVLNGSARYKLTRDPF